jgi:hypothetical protein
MGAIPGDPSLLDYYSDTPASKDTVTDESDPPETMSLDDTYGTDSRSGSLINDPVYQQCQTARYSGVMTNW